MTGTSGTMDESVTRPSAAAAMLAIDRAVAHGATVAVLSPGSRNSALVLAAETHPAIATQVVLDERAAGFLALGIARQTARPVVLICTSGSAGAHYLPAVIEAFYSAVPLIVMTANRPPEAHRCGAPQTVAQANFFADHLRGQWLPTTSAERWDLEAAGEALDAAFGAGLGPVPGPVHIDVPLRKPLWSPGVGAAAVQTAQTVWRSVVNPDGATLDALAEAFAGRPGLVTVGPDGPPSAALNAALDRLAALGVPILAEAASGCRFGRPGRIAGGEILLANPRFAAAHRARWVLRLGGVATTSAMRRVQAELPGAEVVGVDPGGRWRDPERRVDKWVVGDPAEVAAGLAERLAGRHATAGWQADFAAADQRVAAVFDVAAERTDWSGGIARRLVAALPEDALLHVASSSPIRDLEVFGGGGKRALTVLASRGANGIDGTLATAGGSALAAPGRPLVALLGDLAFHHDIGGLRMLAAQAIPLTALVLDNGGGGIFERLPIAAHRASFERNFLAPSPLPIEPIAVALGATVRTTNDPSDVVDALNGGLNVLRAVVDRRVDEARRSAALSAAGEVV
jgi:2-succinyl-5-enolpyruvyl-6-hydroxy-3-cyclohexene-1-carboxylate synthase